MYRAILNDSKESEVRKSGENNFRINNKNYLVERYQGEQGLLMISNGQVQHKVRIIKADHQTKSFLLKINGSKHWLQIRDKFDLLLEELGLNSGEKMTLNQIKAPMPGLILEVNVSAGDQVSMGDKMIVLEAMKMENVIKSPGEGVVSEVKVSKGDSVEKNQVMIKF